MESLVELIKEYRYLSIDLDTTKQGFSKGFYQDTKEYLGINGFRHLKDTNY